MTEFHSIVAATGKEQGEAITANTLEDVAEACAKAEEAFAVYRNTSLESRARFLERIADEILAIGDPLIEAAMSESGLPRARLEGERGRTVGQLKLFADVVRKGLWQQLRIDNAQPDRAPLPRPDLRLRMVPLGPVAVFGASNFPLAFSTAGGDTASALAAGCTVVEKGHPAHPITASLVAQAINKAVAESNLPEGVFTQLVGPSHELGGALVQNPYITAVGFTGSRGGGLALVKLAQQRPVPIPVYAEMSSINPVILLPHALKSRASELGPAFAASLTMGAGQFCTNPGLILAIDGEGADEFVATAGGSVTAAAAQTMLTPAIGSAYAQGTGKLVKNNNVDTVAAGEAAAAMQGQAMLFQTRAAAFLSDETLSDEVFGASSIIVRCKDEAELIALLSKLEGQLTATLHMDAEDQEMAARLLPVLERKVGRILANGWPTGVEVSHAMVHGGPYPSTSDSRTTSVGSLAIDRFLRPVCYQNLAQNILPEPLRDTALSDGVPKLVDGVLTIN